MLTTIVNCTLAFVITVICIKLITPLAVRLQLVDCPNERKSHQGQVPLIGGIAMFVGFSFALLALNQSLEDYRAFLAASLLLIIVGVLDDFHELSAKARFAAQIVAVLIMALWGGNYLYDLGNLFFIGNIKLGILAVPFTLFAVVGVINAVNMIDGMDGVSGGLAIVEFALLALLAYLVQDYVAMQILLPLIAVLLAFLVFNYGAKGKSRIFMGDAGSLFIGFTLSWFLVALSQGQHPAARPITMLWIMGLPVFDTVRLLIMRAWQQKSPFAPDRNHIHHLLEYQGMHQRMVPWLLAGFALSMGLGAIIAGHLHIAAGDMLLGFFALFGLYYGWCYKAAKRSLFASSH